MKIVKERTRLIFTEFTPNEKVRLDDLVGTIDKVFSYEDPGGKVICFPPGMEASVKAAFPKVPIDDRSGTYWDYARITPVQHNTKPRNKLQEDFISFVLENANKKKNLAGILSPGTGKMEPYSRKIPTPNGWIRMGDLEVGDIIFGSHGQPIHVTGVYDHGVQDIYKITFDDGRTAYCGKDHLWNVFIDDDNTMQRTVSTEQMLEDFKVYDEDLARDRKDPHVYKYRIPTITAPVKYNRHKLPVDPYVVGLFIGNGLSTGKFLVVNTSNEMIPNVIAREFGLTYNVYAHHRCEFRYPDGHSPRTADIFKDVPELVGKYSHEKIIPDMYMYASVEARMSLLRGLMDSNGSISQAGHRYEMSYTSTSKTLLEQIQYLVRGLGYFATITPDRHRSDHYSKGYCGRIGIRVPHKYKHKFFNRPDRQNIAYKAAYYKKDNRERFKYLTVKNIEFSHREEARCIQVDARDQLYLTEDFIVTHNTFMACYSAIRVGLRTLIIVPTTGIKVQWGETLTDMFHVDPSHVKMVNQPSDFVNVKADFVVVSQATLASLNKNYELERIIRSNKFGIKVIDEVQMWFHNIIKVDGNSNICHNWYLTGTFGRSGEEENQLYQTMFGDLAMFREQDKKPTFLNPKPGNVYGMKPHMHVKMMWCTSGLSKEEIRAVSKSIRYSERAGKWMRYGISIPSYTELIFPSDGTMTKFVRDLLRIIKQAERSVDYGRTLILGSTINTVEMLAELVRRMFPDKKVGTYHSRNPKQENENNKTTCDILISTVSSCGTGFDMKDLSKLVVFAQYKSWILSDQVSGRLRRRPDGRDTYMWDVVDSSVPQLRAWASARADVLKRKSKTFKVIDV